MEAGQPPAATSVTIGRADLSGTAGRMLPAVHVLPYPGRDGGYDLTVTGGRIAAFDYEHVGTQQYLVLYRPGNRTVWMVGRRPAG